MISNNCIGFLLGELYMFVNCLVILLYYGFYTITKKYFVSYKQNVLFPLLITLFCLLIEIKFPFENQYVLVDAIIVTPFNTYIKILVNIIAVIFFLISYYYIYHFKLNNYENNILILIIQLGVFITISSNNIILLYLSLELITISTYLLVSINKISVYNIEVGLKYFIVGSVSSGMLLLGFSFIYGITGMINLQQIYIFFYYSFITDLKNTIINFYLILSMLFVLTGLLFKIYAAPFHLWISDIYEGTPFHTLFYINTVPSLIYTLVLLQFTEMFNPIISLANILLVFSVLSMALGIIGALFQRRLKRLLAYSSITHVGYFLLLICIYLKGHILGISSFFFYYLFYLLNISFIFSILLQNIVYSSSFKKKILDQLINYRGLYYVNNFQAFLMMVSLFSIAGIPPFVGFFSKLYLIMSLLISYTSWYIVVLFIFMTVLSCFYYINLIKNIYYYSPDRYTFIFHNINIAVIANALLLFILLFLFINNYAVIIVNYITLCYIL